MTVIGCGGRKRRNIMMNPKACNCFMFPPVVSGNSFYGRVIRGHDRSDFKNQIINLITSIYRQMQYKSRNKCLKFAIASYTILALVLMTQSPCLRYGLSTFTSQEERCQFWVAYYDSINHFESRFFHIISYHILHIVSSVKGVYSYHFKIKI